MSNDRVHVNVQGQQGKPAPSAIKLSKTDSLKKVKMKIAVMSGKGGVGKSFVTMSLAVGFALRGLKVGVLDADIYGPTIPKLLGLTNTSLYLDDKRQVIIPAVGPLGIKVVSMDFLLPSEDTAVVWRGALVAKAVDDFLSNVDWGELDALLIDLPPGTGDAPLTMAQMLSDQMTGSVIVTIPSDVSMRIVKKSIDFSKKLKIPIIGIVENMCCFTCPESGKTYNIFGRGIGEEMAKQEGLQFLGRIPMDPRISEANDAGVPFLLKYPDIEAAQRVLEIVDKILEENKDKLSGQQRKTLSLMKLPGEEEDQS
ncbi:ATP-binding protein [Thermocladium modestius]|uniref:Iron-sulfur cluster carrier protein n=1 Tax=Thermocladium modestius TaxID=62609 RepID=A0A830GV35_9CREN|nr:Mrp/NBP35 family ATP-binding protein [Thermocladium modestius]GGP20132.1 ATP-binding protein [Thermocladium modestius]